MLYTSPRIRPASAAVAATSYMRGSLVWSCSTAARGLRDRLVVGAFVCPGGWAVVYLRWPVGLLVPRIGGGPVDRDGGVALGLLGCERADRFFAAADLGGLVRFNGRSGGQRLEQLVPVGGVCTWGGAVVIEDVPVPFIPSVRVGGVESWCCGGELGGDGTFEFSGEGFSAGSPHGFFECEARVGGLGRGVVEIRGVVGGAEGFGVDHVPVDGAAGFAVGELVGDEQHGDRLDALGLLLDRGDVAAEPVWVGEGLCVGRGDHRVGIGGGVADDRHEVGVEFAVHDAGVQFAAVAGDLAVGEVVGGS